MEACFRGRSSAHKQTKLSVHGSTPSSSQLASLYAERASPLLLLRSNHDNEGHTGFTYIYLYGIARNAYIRHTALGSLLTFNGWLLSRPGFSLAPPTQQPARRHMLGLALRVTVVLARVLVVFPL